MSVSAAAQMLGIGVTKTYELVNAELIPHVRIAGRIRIPVTKLREWADAQVQASGTAL